jgi:calcium/calmodulin-dependent protein kinase I
MAAKQLVNDMKLIAEHHPEGNPHYTSQLDYARAQGQPMKQIWTKEKSFSQGPNGKVWSERCSTSTGDGSARLRVVKMINKPSNPSHRANWEEALKAFAISSRREYREVFVKFFGWYEDSKSIYITMEHVESGDLSQHLLAPLPESEARRIALHILQGLKHLHNNNLMHRSLKLEVGSSKLLFFNDVRTTG